MLEIDFYNHTKSRLACTLFEKLLPAAWKILHTEKALSKSQKWRIELSLVGDRKMQLLNKIHHRKNRPTDVISLSYIHAKMPDGFAGEIFISLPYARRQAFEIKQSLAAELRFLFVHGLLHVFGYDHMNPQEEKHMLNLTYKILRRAV